MSTPEIEQEEARMLARLGWNSHPYSRLFAKLEIFFGLLALATGVIGGTRLAVIESREHTDITWIAWAGNAALIVLGGYLALAGHRSHLYQSNNRIAAYLAELLRNTTPPRDRT